MKKIGILTYHPYNNYGAVLQVYALQAFISKTFQSNVEVINFNTERQQGDNDILQLKGKNNIRSIVAILLYRGPIYCKLKLRRRRFDIFRKNYLNLTIRFKDVKSLWSNLPEEDVYISGSDQVFNPLAEYTEVYYLGFPKKTGRKIAYAPSFGLSNIEEAITEELKSRLKDFDSLSCREKNGAEYLSKLLNKKVPCVADPVFLLSAEQWSQIAKTTQLANQFNGGYIFVYRLNGGKELMSLAAKISSATGLPIICVAPDFRFLGKCRMDYSAGPEEMLGYIRHASYVVTDSFHGTALSLVFGTKVITYVAFPKAADRITTIMKRFHLIQNVIFDIETFNFNELSFLDYSQYLKEYIAESVSYLKQALN